MQTFRNLRLSARLGAAFGFLIVALLVIALVGPNSVGKVNGTAESLSGRDPGGYVVVRRAEHRDEGPFDRWWFVR